MPFCLFQVKPSIKKDRISDNAMITSANESVHLNCNIRRSSPPPTLTWWYTTCPKDATACQPSLDAEWKRFKTDNISSLEQLLIPPSRDHVLYKCIAENWLGQDSITYTILRRLGRYKKKIFWLLGNRTENYRKVHCRVRTYNPLYKNLWKGTSRCDKNYGPNRCKISYVSRVLISVCTVTQSKIKIITVQ